MYNKIFLFLFMTIIFFPSCDWREFDDLTDEANVQVISNPEGFPDSFFGQITTSLLDQEGNTIPGIFLVGGNGDFALIDFSGPDIKVNNISWEVTESFSLNNLIPLRGGENFYRFIANSNGSVYILALSNGNTDDDYVISELDKFSNLALAHYGRVVIPATKPDSGQYIIATENKLLLQTSGSTDATEINLGSFDLPAPHSNQTHQNFLASIKLDGLNYIITGGITVDSNSDPIWGLQFIPFDGHLESFDPDTRIILSGNDDYPGSQVNTLIVDHFDEDDQEDLLVGTDANIYIYLSTATNNSPMFNHTPDKTLYNQNNNLGKVITCGDLTGNGNKEIIAADYTSSSDSSDNEEFGNVSIFTTPITKSKISPAINLQAPKKEIKFGSSLLVVPSVQLPQRQELIIGGANSAYLIFLTGLEGDNDPEQNDPRNYFQK
ncbi:MAG: hypothetical protein PF689_08585 [Deltaproteobacteria bacterium]|jgi:hypothetical protein|nr:hypothetical protein [Deltaproteobacteria bacterium]